MKKQINTISPAKPTKEEISDYAYHLCLQRGRVDGHDVDDWLEAEACLLANTPKNAVRTKKQIDTVSPSKPTKEEIRDYAYHLYLQRGRVDGHDIDDWLEAEACLLANTPKNAVHARLHRHTRNLAARATVAFDGKREAA